MAKVQIKSEKITAFGGIFFVLDKFDSILSSVIDSHLGLRSTLIGYQYSEIIRAIFSVFCCGGDCMEDLNLYLKDVLTERPHTRVPSADTVLRGIEELATENISYTAEKTGNVYDFNTAEKLNQLLIKLLLATGQLTEGGRELVLVVDYNPNSPISVHLSRKTNITALLDAKIMEIDPQVEHKTGKKHEKPIERMNGKTVL